MKFFDVRGLIGLHTSRIEDAGRRFKQLRFSLRDLVRMDVETLGQLRDGLIALDGGYRHLRFESRRVISTSASFQDVCSLRDLSTRGAQNHHLMGCPNHRGHLCSPQGDAFLTGACYWELPMLAGVLGGIGSLRRLHVSI